MQIARSPSFLLSLFLLLLNDAYLKSHHPSWFTGKLSDFAGLMVVSTLAFALARGRVFFAGCLIASTFVWWKSPLSDSFLTFINGLGAYRFGRVVDYSDLLALSMLPAAAAVVQAHERKPRHVVRRTLQWPVLGLTLVAVSGTSLSRFAREFAIRSADPLSEVTVDAIAIPIMKRHNCDVSTARRCDTKKFSVEYVVKGAEVEFIVTGTRPLFFSSSYVRDADKMVDELKQAFAAQIPGLEYIENLDARVCNDRITAGCMGR